MKNCRKNVLKRSNGITLIALVITIIVLLILAGISISMLSGDNGILQKTTDAKTQTGIGQEKEQIQLEVLGSYETNGNLLIGTVNANIKNHIRGVTTNEATQFPLKVTYTETGNTYIVDGNGNVEKKKPVTIPQGLQVGSNVTYAPTGGTYNWAAEYCSSSKTIGTDDVTLYSTASGTGTNMKQTSWKVFKIDNDSGEVQLVPSAAIGSVYLGQAQGYNNAVQLLDGACNALYSHSSKGITARSIDMDDIEPLIDQTKLQTQKDKYNHNNTSSSYSHLNSIDQVTNPYTSNNYFSRIYEEENKSVINGNEKSGGLGLSAPGSKLYLRTEETSLTGQTTGVNATNGYLKASTNIQPYQTYYYWSSALSTSGNYADSTTASAYSTMLNNTYWVASRCVRDFTNYCCFSVRFVNGGSLDNSLMFCSDRDAYDSSRGLFPVVSLDASLISADGSNFKVEL